MASTGAAQHLHPHSELRRSKRLILGGSKKKAQFLEFSSSLMQNEEKQMEINAVPNRPQTEKGNAAGNDKLFLCSKERSDSGFQDLPNIEARAIVGGGGGRISGSTITFGSPRTTRSRQQRAGTFDLDNPSLYYPILPNNPNFFCCFGFLHITVSLFRIICCKSEFWILLDSC
jgi:hypothetical protein